MRLVTFRDAGGSERVGRVDGDAIAVFDAPSMLDYLAAGGANETGETHSLTDVQLLAPILSPPSVRDFFAFEGHVAAGWRRRGGEIPPAWYDAPVFYFSNPASIVGPDAKIVRPGATEMLDFELEIAAVIGADGGIAGYTLMNDWSARDVQREEMTVGLGPAKGKDFATSLGPWLVSPDDLPIAGGRLEVTATVTLNGEELSRTNAAEMHWSWPELVAHAARDTRLHPGDVLGSGTLNRGCLLELLEDGNGHWLQPGDEVVIAAEGLGELGATIGA